MPMVTQTRVFPAARLLTSRHRVTSPEGVVRTTAGSSLPISGGSQTTTSWRTGNSVNQDGSSTVGRVDYDKRTGQQLREGLRNEYRRRYDTGHPFLTEKTLEEYTHASTRFQTSRSRSGDGSAHWYEGYLIPGTFGVIPAITYPSIAALEQRGRQAIAATIPTKPEANLAALLGELRSRLPAAPGASLLRGGATRQSVGAEYLNVEFGLKPLQRDIYELLGQVANVTNIIDNFVKNSEKPVRRKRLLHEATTMNQNVQTFASAPFMGFNQGVDVYSRHFVSGSQRTTASTAVTQRIWFSGAYSYHVAQAESLLSHLQLYEQRANHLLGTRITADTIYQLTPWSWLLDWVSDFGTFVTNLTYLNSDSTVLRYGYVMAETRSVTTSTTVLVPKGSGPSSVSGTVTRQQKRRIRSTPYGFGLKTEAFTPRQWAILGALGMTKSPRSLRQTD